MPASSTAGGAVLPNAAHECCGRWAAERGRLALYCTGAGIDTAWSFWDIQREADRFSNVLAALGVMGGDQVALMLPQRAETAAAHIACYQMGAIAAPLASGLDAATLVRRLMQARVAIVDAAAAERLAQLRTQLPELKRLIGLGGTRAPWLRDWAVLRSHAAAHRAAPCHVAADAAALLFDDDSAVAPVAVTHAALAGHAQRFLAAHAGYPQGGDLFWSPADWSTRAGLLEGLLPAWRCGQPVVACDGDFTAAAAFGLIAKYDVRNIRLTPDQLAAMMTAVPQPKTIYDCHVRTVATGGAAIAPALSAWLAAELGVAGGGRGETKGGQAP